MKSTTLPHVPGTRIQVQLGDCMLLLQQSDYPAFSPRKPGEKSIAVSWVARDRKVTTVESVAQLSLLINGTLDLSAMDCDETLVRIALIVTGLHCQELFRIASPVSHPFLAEEYGFTENSPQVCKHDQCLSWLICKKLSPPRQVHCITFDAKLGSVLDQELAPHAQLRQLDDGPS